MNKPKCDDCGSDENFIHDVDLTANGIGMKKLCNYCWREYTASIPSRTNYKSQWD